MGRFVMLSENFWNTRIFPKHALAANSEAPDQEITRVSSGRRQRSRNLWTTAGGQENTLAYVTCTFDRVRVGDTVVLDRGHNVKGKTVRVRYSSDGFSTYTEDAAVIPSSVFPYSRLAQSNGILTEEGAWLWRHGARSGSACRIVFDAMGGGLKPEVVGLYMGMSFRPELALVKPFSHGKRELDYATIRSPSAWVGAGEISQRRHGQFRLRVARGNYGVARYHVEELFLRARPSWIMPDDDEAEKAYLSRAEPQTAGFEIPQGQFDYVCDIDCPEHEPRVA